MKINRKGLRGLWIAAGISVVLLSAVLWCFRGVGRWLVVEDDVAPADAIVVLSGRMPLRALEAARIYRRGVSPRVWVTRPLGPAVALRKMGIAYIGEEFYSQRVLFAAGVPFDAVRVLEHETTNTQDELTEVFRLLQAEGSKAVIVVTTKPHTRRVHAIWNRLSRASASKSGAPPPRLIVRYPADDPFDAAHWWRTTRDAQDVLRECLGLANAWAGFPARFPTN